MNSHSQFVVGTNADAITQRQTGWRVKQKMKNCNFAVEGTVLTITVDLSERHGLSKSGKSEAIASTDGNVAVPGFEDVKIGLNIYTPAAVKPAAKNSKK